VFSAALKVQQLFHSIFCEYVVATTDPFDETKRDKQLA
jgi:hypothetical protein